MMEPINFDELNPLPYIIDEQGHKRPLGHVPDPPGTMRLAPSWVDQGLPLIERDQWVEFDEFPYDLIQIKDQNGFGACNGHASATTIEMARYATYGYGYEYIPMSAWWVYWSLTGGRDSGSNISEALSFLKQNGCAPEADVPYGQASRSRNWTPQAKQNAPRFKIEIGAAITTADELGTAVQRRQAVNLAVAAGGGFTRLDSDGVPGFGVACNHAVAVGLGMKKSKSGQWLVLMINSWTKQYGINGTCWLPVDVIVRKMYFDAYTILTPSIDPLDPLPNPIV